MATFLATLPALTVMTVLFIAAVILILIDYFFPVDYPAYLGYACFALGAFFVFPFGVSLSMFASLVVFAVLLTLHMLWFSRYLTNAPTRP